MPEIGKTQKDYLADLEALRELDQEAQDLAYTISSNPHDGITRAEREREIRRHTAEAKKANTIKKRHESNVPLPATVGGLAFLIAMAIGAGFGMFFFAIIALGFLAKASIELSNAYEAEKSRQYHQGEIDLLNNARLAKPKSKTPVRDHGDAPKERVQEQPAKPPQAVKQDNAITNPGASANKNTPPTPPVVISPTKETKKSKEKVTPVPAATTPTPASPTLIPTPAFAAAPPAVSPIPSVHTHVQDNSNLIDQIKKLLEHNEALRDALNKGAPAGAPTAASTPAPAVTPTVSSSTDLSDIQRQLDVLKAMLAARDADIGAGRGSDGVDSSVLDGLTEKIKALEGKLVQMADTANKEVDVKINLDEVAANLRAMLADANTAAASARASEAQLLQGLDDLRRLRDELEALRVPSPRKRVTVTEVVERPDALGEPGAAAEGDSTEVKNLKDRLRDAQEGLENLKELYKNRLNGRDEEQAESDKELQELRNKLRDQAKELADLLAEINGLEAINEALVDAEPGVRTIYRDRESGNDGVEELESAIARLRAAAEAEKDDYEGHIKVLEEALSESKAKLQALEASLNQRAALDAAVVDADHQAEKNALMREADAAKRALRDAQEELNQVKGSYANLEGRRAEEATESEEEHERELQALREQLSQQAANAAEKIADLLDRIKGLEDLLGAFAESGVDGPLGMTAGFGLNTAAKDAMDDAVAAVRTGLDRFRKDLAESERLEDTEGFQGSLKSMAGALANMQAQLEEFKKNAGLSGITMDALEAEREALERAHARELNKLRQQSEGAEADLKEAQSKVAALREEHHKDMNEQQQESDAAQEKLKKKLADKAEELADLMKKMKALRDAMAAVMDAEPGPSAVGQRVRIDYGPIEEELDVLRNALGEHHRRMGEDSDDRFDGIVADNKDLQATLLRRLQLINADLLAKFAGLEDLLAAQPNWAGEGMSGSDENSETSDRLDIWREEIEDFRIQLQQSKAELEAYQGSLDVNADELEKARIRAEKAEANLAQAAAEAELRRKDWQAANARLVDALNDSDDHDEEMERLMAAMKKSYEQGLSEWKDRLEEFNAQQSRQLADRDAKLKELEEANAKLADQVRLRAESESQLRDQMAQLMSEMAKLRELLAGNSAAVSSASNDAATDVSGLNRDEGLDSEDEKVANEGVEGEVSEVSDERDRELRLSRSGSFRLVEATPVFSELLKAYHGLMVEESEAKEQFAKLTEQIRDIGSEEGVVEVAAEVLETLGAQLALYPPIKSFIEEHQGDGHFDEGKVAAYRYIRAGESYQKRGKDALAALEVDIVAYIERAFEVSAREERDEGPEVDADELKGALGLLKRVNKSPDAPEEGENLGVGSLRKKLQRRRAKSLSEIDFGTIGGASGSVPVGDDKNAIDTFVQGALNLLISEEAGVDNIEAFLKDKEKLGDSVKYMVNPNEWQLPYVFKAPAVELKNATMAELPGYENNEINVRDLYNHLYDELKALLERLRNLETQLLEEELKDIDSLEGDSTPTPSPSASPEIGSVTPVPSEGEDVQLLEEQQRRAAKEAVMSGFNVLEDAMHKISVEQRIEVINNLKALDTKLQRDQEEIKNKIDVWLPNITPSSNSVSSSPNAEFKLSLYGNAHSKLSSGEDISVALTDELGVIFVAEFIAYFVQMVDAGKHDLSYDGLMSLQDVDYILQNQELLADAIIDNTQVDSLKAALRGFVDEDYYEEIFPSDIQRLGDLLKYHCAHLQEYRIDLLLGGLVSKIVQDQGKDIDKCLSQVDVAQLDMELLYDTFVDSVLALFYDVDYIDHISFLSDPKNAYYKDYFDQLRAKYDEQVLLGDLKANPHDFLTFACKYLHEHELSCPDTEMDDVSAEFVAQVKVSHVESVEQERKNNGVVDGIDRP